MCVLPGKHQVLGKSIQWGKTIYLHGGKAVGKMSVRKKSTFFNDFSRTEEKKWSLPDYPQAILANQGFFFQLYPLHVNSLHTNFSAHWFVISFSKGKTPAILFLNHFKSLKGQHQQLVARAGVNP